MPKEKEGLDDGVTLIEYRGIRGGERGDRAPVKTLPRVRMPTRNPQTKKFDVDLRVMRAAAMRQGLEADKWAESRWIPVYVLSDIVVGGIIYVERALYSAAGRLCSSAWGEETARCEVDLEAYARTKTRTKIASRDIPCTPSCPLWEKEGRRTDCHWRAVTTVQLADDPVFPSPVKHRTTSKNAIKAMITSLNYIASITGGVLMGIPLIFRQSQIEVRDGGGEMRRIPVMTFDFMGTVGELRVAAAAELSSRSQLLAAVGGKIVAPLPTRVVYDLGDGEQVADDAEAESEEEEQRHDLAEVMSRIAMLYKQLGYTPTRQRMLEDKHQGDLDAILRELRSLAPTEFKPQAGVAVDETLFE